MKSIQQQKISRKRPVAALTGSIHRMKSLPYVNISQIECHSLSPQPMITTSDDKKQERIDMFSHEHENRKCVYTYEDIYSFARILTSDSLVFDSHFESGNLHSAFRVLNSSVNSSKNQVYDLYLHSDINTIGHTQWFYFSVSNVRQGQEVTFVIRNFSKPDSLYNDGMRPLLYSSKSKRGWERCGSNICYFNTTPTKSSDSAKPIIDSSSNLQDGKKKLLSSTYVLCFTHTFEFSSDVCFFSYCHPYTYTDLQLYLDRISSMRMYSKYLRRSILCKTIAGNNCDMLTITAPAASPEELSERVVIILTARVHPGESNASWIVEGMIDYLLQDNDEAHMMRKLYIFKIIPMVNPDGVINGNYRTSLAGCDLNRKWLNPDIKLHPTIYHIKQLMIRLHKHQAVGVILDIHGHSQKQGVFVYGCMPDKRLLRASTPCVHDHHNFFVDDHISPSYDVETTYIPPSSTSSSMISLDRLYPSYNNTNRDVLNYRVTLLPRIFASSIPTFHLDSCSFKMHRAKASTMRMVAFTELGIDCVYTIEASLAGKYPYHYNAHDLLQVGKDIAIAILSAYLSLAPKTTKFYDDIISSKHTDHHVSSSSSSSSSEKMLNIINSYNTMTPDRKLRMSSYIRTNPHHIIQFYDEMICWRRYYDPRQNIGYLMMSDTGMHELYGDIHAVSSNDNSDVIQDHHHITPKVNSKLNLYHIDTQLDDVKDDTKKKIILLTPKRTLVSAKVTTNKASVDDNMIIPVLDKVKILKTYEIEFNRDKQVDVIIQPPSIINNVKLGSKKKKKKKKDVVSKVDMMFTAATLASAGKKTDRPIGSDKPIGVDRVVATGRRRSIGASEVAISNDDAWMKVADVIPTIHIQSGGHHISSYQMTTSQIPSSMELLEGEDDIDIDIIAASSKKNSHGRYAHKLLHKDKEPSSSLSSSSMNPVIGRIIKQSSTSKLLSSSSSKALSNVDADDVTPSPKLLSKRYEKSETSLNIGIKHDNIEFKSNLISSKDVISSSKTNEPLIKLQQPNVIRKKSPVEKKQSKSKSSSSKLSFVSYVMSAISPKHDDMDEHEEDDGENEFGVPSGVGIEESMLASPTPNKSPRKFSKEDLSSACSGLAVNGSIVISNRENRLQGDACISPPAEIYNQPSPHPQRRVKKK